MNDTERLARLGLVLPGPENPGFDYLPYKVHAGVVRLAGQLAKENGEVARVGRVGVELDENEAKRQARLCALQALAWLRHAGDGDLARISEVLHVNVYVACDPSFDGISRIADAASGLIIDVLGERGRHPRSVLGMTRLPRGAPVMIDLEAALD